MTRRHRIIVSLIILGVFISLTGCYSRNEIEETAFVVAWGLEKGQEKKYKLTVQVAAPSKVAGEGGGGGGDGEPYWLGVAEGETFYDAIRELSKRSSRLLHFSHAEALIINEEVAREGLNPIIDILTRETSMRPDMSIFITSEPVDKILKVASDLENLPSTYISRLESRRYTHEEVNEFNVKHFYNHMQIGNEAAIPRINTWKEPQKGTGKQEPSGGGENIMMSASTGGAQGGQQPPPGEEEPAKELILQGAAIFKDDKMIDWLTGPDVRTMKWIEGEIIDGPLIGDIDGCLYSVRVRESNTRTEVKPNLNDLSSSTINISIKTEADLTEVDRPNVIVNSQILSALSDNLSKQLEEQMKEFIRKVKYDLQSDFLGFGELIRRNVPHRVWEQAEPDWNDQFKNLAITVKVDMVVRRVGMTVRSPFAEKR